MRAESIRTTTELLRQADAVLVEQAPGCPARLAIIIIIIIPYLKKTSMILRKPMEFKVFFRGSITFTQSRNSSGVFTHAI